MNLTINGKTQKLEPKTNIAGLLEILKLDPSSSLAIAINLEVIPKNRYETTFLKEGDAVEILNPVAGG